MRKRRFSYYYHLYWILEGDSIECVSLCWRRKRREMDVCVVCEGEVAFVRSFTRLVFCDWQTPNSIHPFLPRVGWLGWLVGWKEMSVGTKASPPFQPLPFFSLLFSSSFLFFILFSPNYLLPSPYSLFSLWPLLVHFLPFPFFSFYLRTHIPHL